MTIIVYFQGKAQDKVIYFHQLLHSWNSMAHDVLMAYVQYVDEVSYGVSLTV